MEPFAVLSAGRNLATVRYPMLGLVSAARKAGNLGPDAPLQVCNQALLHHASQRVHI